MPDLNGYKKFIPVILGLMGLFLTIAGTAWVQAGRASEKTASVENRQAVTDEQIKRIQNDIQEIKMDVKQLLRK